MSNDAVGGRPSLVVGSKAYSSWSLRAWLALRVSGIDFEEISVPLGRDDTRARLLAHSPAGKVPVLKDGSIRVWDSLAIIEYAAERWPEAGLWPTDRAARALARSIAAEMHSGFMPLRRHFPMDLRRSLPGREATPEAAADIARIGALWAETRAAHGGSGGPFLFGRFTAADAMYAPVVARFETYGVDAGPVGRAYMDAMLALPALRDWYAAARTEPAIARYEAA
jgi:glutathione S-transferase